MNRPDPCTAAAMRPARADEKARWFDALLALAVTLAAVASAVAIVVAPLPDAAPGAGLLACPAAGSQPPPEAPIARR